MLRKLDWQTFLKFFLFCLVCACGIEKDKVLAPDKPVFKTTDATRLFFKNTRQIYYDKEEIGRDRLEVYRKKDRNTDSTVHSLNILIGNNWMYDEAYIRFESNTPMMPITELTVKWIQEAEQGIYRLENNSKESHFALATQLYQAVLKKQQLFLLQGKEEVPVLHTQTQKETFRVTMIDFYRLVGLM